MAEGRHGGARDFLCLVSGSTGLTHVPILGFALGRLLTYLEVGGDNMARAMTEALGLYPQGNCSVDSGQNLKREGQRYHNNKCITLCSEQVFDVPREVLQALKGSYEKEGILQNTVGRVLAKVPILGQRIHEMRDTSCSICAKQALERCPMEVLKVSRNGTEPKVTLEELHQVLRPSPHRFMGLMQNIVSKMRTQAKIDLERAREKEARENLSKLKKVGEKVIDTLDEILH